MATTPKIRYDIEAAVSGGGDVEALAGQLEGLANTLEGDLKTQALASAEALRQLGAKQGAIENFRELKTEVSSAATRLREAQTAAQALGTQLGNTAPTRAQAGQMQKLRDDVRAAKAELQAQTLALDASRAALRTAGVSTDQLATSERNVRAAIAAARVEVEQLAPAYSRAGAAAQTAGRQQAAATATAGAGLRGLGDQLRTIQNIALTALGGSFIGSLARDVSEVADEYQNLGARIKLVTGEGAAFDEAFAGVKEIALATNSELDATATLFARIAQAGAEMGVTQQQSLALTQTINQAIQLSGGSADSAKAAIVQLVQGLQSGVLRGEEFNSVMEQSPRLARALADGLGVGIGQLREMAKQGKLTSETVIQALQGQADAVATEFAKLPPTVGRAIQNLSTNWTVYVGEVDKATGASQSAADAINAVANNLDEIVGVATRAGAVLVAALAVQAAGAVRAYAVETTAAAGATNLLALSMSKVPTALKITVAAVGFEVGYQIGEMLYENSEYARKLGIGLVGYFEGIVSGLTLLKDSAAAIFTDDTVGAAFDRFKARNQELADTLQAMWQDAEQAPGKIEPAAKKAADAVASIGSEALKSTAALQKAATEAVAALDALRIARSADQQVALSGLQTQLELARQSEQMALLLGREKDAHAAKVEQIKIEIQITLAKTEVARAEAQGSIAVAQAKLEELRLSGEINAVKEAELQASIRLAQAKLAEAEAVGKSVAIQQKQLEILSKAGAGLSNYSDGVEKATRGQREFASATRDANAALQEQATASGRYSSPLGDTKYSRPAGGSVTGNTREERLAGQAASDNTLLFNIRDKLNAGTLGAGDEASIRAALEAIRTNDAIARDVPQGLISNAGQQDLAMWRNVASRLEQQLATASVGRKVVIDLNNNGKKETVTTDEAGAAALVRSLQSAALSAGR